MYLFDLYLSTFIIRQTSMSMNHFYTYLHTLLGLGFRVSGLGAVDFAMQSLYEVSFNTVVGFF
jgi:hypothetical protein